MFRSERISPFLAAGPAIFLMWLLQKYPESLAAKVFIGLIGIFIILGVLSNAAVLSYNINYFGREEFIEANKILREYNYILNHQADRMFLTMSYLAVFIFAQGLLFNHWWIIVSLYYFTLSRVIGRRFMPPFVVALGESGSVGEGLVKNITAVAAPLAVRELLKIEINSAGKFVGNISRFQGMYRIGNRALNWQVFVETYCDFAKLIVLDLRNTSPNVDEECEILNKKDLWYKVLIISKDRTGLAARCAGIEFNQDSISKVPIFDAPSELCLAVSRIAKNRQDIPSKERPAWLVLSSANP
jgi:hypothetical protein